MRCVQSPSSGTTAGWGEVQTVLPVEQGAVCTSVVLCGGRPCEVLHVEKGYIAKTKVAICLRFLATGESFRSIGFSCRVGATTVGTIV
ncbi:hypothetical protein LSAT2_031847 [Lamellibrachia satsuma]|nr:hypothetical protein LSAT2_031847 [Lamellibrachia satsuma]